MKKIHLFSLTAILCMALFGCNATSDNVENVNEDATKGETEGEKGAEESNSSQSNTKDVVEDNQDDIVLTTGPIETVIRKNEGVDQEIKVLNYQIQPFNISYQLDEIFDVPEVKQNQITYSTQNNEYKIVLEIIEHKSLEETVSNLQEKFETEGYEEKGELECTPSEENSLRGKMQYFTSPMKGFYAYEIDEHVLVITYQYPVEAGDGMHPLLVDLRKTINVQ